MMERTFQPFWQDFFWDVPKLVHISSSLERSRNSDIKSVRPIQVQKNAVIMKNSLSLTQNS